jgi:hypothetical protein
MSVSGERSSRPEGAVLCPDYSEVTVFVHLCVSVPNSLVVLVLLFQVLWPCAHCDHYLAPTAARGCHQFQGKASALEG